MTASLSKDALGLSSQLVRESLGLHFPEPRWADLSRGLTAAARGLGLGGAPELVARMAAGTFDEHQTEVLASYLTVGETYLFRDPRCFEAIERDILPPLIARAHWRRLRVWSVGCSTGEEPYSLALVLDRLLPNPEEWHVTILATDLNVRSLETAQAGVYTRWSFRQVEPHVLQAYFTERGKNRFELCERIRSRVTFAYLNLVADPYPSLVNNTAGMDLILCRNVLMYFEADRAARVVSDLRRCLAADGTLILGPAELHLGHQVGMRAVQHRGSTCFTDTPGPKRSTSPTRVDLLSWPDSPSPRPALPPEPAFELPPPPPPSPQPLRPLNGTAPAVSPVNVAERARLLHESGRDREAVVLLRELLDRGVSPAATGTEGADAMLLLARSLANLGHLGEALDWCDRAILLDKMRPTPHFLRSTVLQERGELDEATASLRRALYLDPDYVVAHFAMATLARRGGRSAEARRHLVVARDLLARHGGGSAFPEFEGLEASRMAQIVDTMLDQREQPQ